MKNVVILILLFGAGYYFYTNHSPFQTDVTDPYFVEIRINDLQSDLQIVGFGKMNSYADCQGRAAIIWAKAFEKVGKVSIDTACNKQISKKYQRLFENQPIQATYIVFDKGTDRERDGRFVIYGVASSHVAQQCSIITRKVRQSYNGKIYCVQGTVG